MTKELTIQKLVNDDGFIKKTEKQLGNRTHQFLSSVLTLYNSDTSLQQCDPIKLYNTCLMAAALDLPVNNNLGQAYVIAYKGVPQLQIGWKGFVQLAQRSGKFKTLNVTDVKNGEISTRDRLTGEVSFDWIQNDSERLKAKTVGYIAYFELLNGFSKSLYMTNEELQSHAKSYSQTYKKDGGVWKDNFDAMARKTVIKLLLSKYAPMSIDMGKAIEQDQQDADGKYSDNRPTIDIEDAQFGESESDESEQMIEAEIEAKANELINGKEK